VGIHGYSYKLWGCPSEHSSWLWRWRSPGGVHACKAQGVERLAEAVGLFVRAQQRAGEAEKGVQVCCDVCGGSGGEGRGQLMSPLQK
jgi:hypothetical protein